MAGAVSMKNKKTKIIVNVIINIIINNKITTETITTAAANNIRRKKN